MITNLKKDYNAKRSQNLKFENGFFIDPQATPGPLV